MSAVSFKEAKAAALEQLRLEETTNTKYGYVSPATQPVHSDQGSMGDGSRLTRCTLLSSPPSHNVSLSFVNLL